MNRVGVRFVLGKRTEALLILFRYCILEPALQGLGRGEKTIRQLELFVSERVSTMLQQ